MTMSLGSLSQIYSSYLACNLRSFSGFRCLSEEDKCGGKNQQYRDDNTLHASHGERQFEREGFVSCGQSDRWPVTSR